MRRQDQSAGTAFFLEKKRVKDQKRAEEMRLELEAKREREQKFAEEMRLKQATIDQAIKLLAEVEETTCRKKIANENDLTLTTLKKSETTEKEVLLLLRKEEAARKKITGERVSFLNQNHAAYKKEKPAPRSPTSVMGFIKPPKTDPATAAQQPAQPESKGWFSWVPKPW